MPQYRMRRGQIITLDLVFSLILVVFAIGILLQNYEVSTAYLHEDGLMKDLKANALAASDLLVSNPEFTCEITPGYGHMLNCIDTSKLNQITKENLGLGAQIAGEYVYKCSIDSDPEFPDYCTVLAGRCCDTRDPSVSDYYSVERAVIANDGPVSKFDYLTCLYGTCTLGKSEITITVWR